MKNNIHYISSSWNVIVWKFLQLLYEHPINHHIGCVIYIGFYIFAAISLAIYFYNLTFCQRQKFTTLQI
jgi:hypothetical protein